MFFGLCMTMLSAVRFITKPFAKVTIIPIGSVAYSVVVSRTPLATVVDGCFGTKLSIPDNPDKPFAATRIGVPTSSGLNAISTFSFRARAQGQVFPFAFFLLVLAIRLVTDKR